MKINKKMKSYTNYFVLLIGIIFIFIALDLCKNINAVYIDLFGKRIKADNNILLNEHDEYYLSYNFVKENLDSEIYFDSISKKVVISSKKGLFKVRVNSESISVNFNEENIDNVGVIERDDKYISLEVLKMAYDINITVCNNTIYIYDNIKFEGKLKNNKIGVYIEGNLKSKITQYIDKSDKITVIYEKDNFVFVKLNDDNVGYISNKLVSYTIEAVDSVENNLKSNVYIFADSSNKSIDKDLPIDCVLIDMFEVTQVSTVVNEKNINNTFLNRVKSSGYKMCGIVTNGYNLTGFNTSTMSQILSDETKRLNLINNLNKKIEKYNLDGIVLDFRRLKEKDISNYIQFIKEFKAFTDKDIILNVNTNEYKDYATVINYSDFGIVNTYGQRDLNSTVAGSVCEINWMKNIISSVLKSANSDKVIVGMPAYSILWTEKNSNVVDSEIYNLKAIQDYINKNNLKVKEINGQNYVELKKGSLVYRMWIEDELSIKNRLNIIKDNKLAGVAIYKLGYENDLIINALKNN